LDNTGETAPIQSRALGAGGVATGQKSPRDNPVRRIKRVVTDGLKVTIEAAVAPLIAKPANSAELSERPGDTAAEEALAQRALTILGSRAIRFTNQTTPCRQALGWMLAHPRGELRRAHQAGLHRDVGEVRGGYGLLMAICRGGEAAKHCDDLNHDGISRRYGGRRSPYHLPGLRSAALWPERSAGRCSHISHAPLELSGRAHAQILGQIE
jgi:hypothetical protein